MFAVVTFLVIVDIESDASVVNELYAHIVVQLIVFTNAALFAYGLG